MSNNSRIYKTINKNDIEKIVKNTFDNDTEVTLFKILKGGLFNTTYFVKINKPEKALVLRIAPIRKELLFSFEKNMMASEPVIYKLFEDNNIPAPKVIIHDSSYKIIDREYIITEYIEGIPLSDPAFPKEHREKIQYDFGAYTSKIHSIKSKTFGWANSDSTGFESWSDFIKVFTKEVWEKSLNYNILDEKHIKEFDNFFYKNIKLFDIHEMPSLVHNDLWEPNVLVNKAGERWEIVAIIDADRALYGHSEYEFVLWNNEPKFMEGYGKELDMSPEGKLRRKAYSLILSFVCSYVHKVQYDDLQAYNNCKTWALNELKEIKLYE